MKPKDQRSATKFLRSVLGTLASVGVKDSSTNQEILLLEEHVKTDMKEINDFCLSRGYQIEEKEVSFGLHANKYHNFIRLFYGSVIIRDNYINLNAVIKANPEKFSNLNGKMDLLYYLSDIKDRLFRYEVKNLTILGMHFPWVEKMYSGKWPYSISESKKYVGPEPLSKEENHIIATQIILCAINSGTAFKIESLEPFKYSFEVK